ncbi:hypothetical protein JKF63_00113 [Porcisia hertigi]|uniref:Mannosyltransferase n=1 Tax=Porcisia hertigi TaxID=2761500 RepID=A0A836KWU5_9TRYP|nr:hypothetical protein JKF63_00113 [Porcisia hertigi]
MDVLRVFSAWPRPLQSPKLLTALLLYRLALCLTLRTAESPDEWWQSEEVAYKMVFGRGQLTWEWQDAIRSYVFPAMFAWPLFLLKCTGTDTATTVWASSRCVQAALLFAQDCTMLAVAQRLDAFRSRQYVRASQCGGGPGASPSTSNGPPNTRHRTPTIASTTLAIIVVEWFLIHTGVRSYSSVAESVFFLLALYQTGYRSFLLWAGVACAMRVTAALAVLPVFFVHTFRICRKKGVARGLLLVALITFGMVMSISATMCLVDYYFYHRLVFTPYNFLKLNLLMGVSKHYGVHMSCWYVLVLPILAAPFALFLAWMPACWGWMEVDKEHHTRGVAPYVQSALFSGTSSRTLKQEMVRCFFVGTLTLLFHSLVDHKEMRFVYLLLPLVLLLSSVVVVVLSTTSVPRSKRSARARNWYPDVWVPSAATVGRLFTLCWVANAALATVLLYSYRCGGPTMFRNIRGAERHYEHLEVLTHCYATPGFAQLHGKVERLEWVDCPMKLDALSGVPEVTQSRLFTEQPKAYALWRYLRVVSRLDVENVRTAKEGKLSKEVWWQEMRRRMPESEPPTLPDGVILFQHTAVLLAADFLRPMGYRRVEVVFHALHSFEPDEDSYLELWSRDTV